MKSLNCIHANHGLRTNNDGTMYMCCISTELLTNKNGEIANIKKNKLDDFIFGQKAEEIRNSLLSGIQHKNCIRCWEEEDVGKESKRIRDTRNYKNLISTNIEPRIVEFNLGTTCNLRCRICGPWASSQWNKEYNKIYNFMSDENYKNWLFDLNHSYGDDSLFWEEIKIKIANIKRITILGGEPLLMKKQWELLKYSIENGYSQDQHLAFNTNGTIIDSKYIDLLKNFKHVQVRLSIDGIKKHFEYQRYPAKWKDVYENLLVFKKYSSEFKWHISVSVTINIYNIYYLNDIINFFDNAKIYTHLNLLHDAKWFCIKNIDESVKEKIVNHLQSTIQFKDKVDPIIKFMTSAICDLNMWNKFIDITNKIDISRNENFASTFPEFNKLIQKF